MSENYEELYKKLKEESDANNKNNEEICKEYESTIEMLTESAESFKKQKESLEQKLLKYEKDIKSLTKEKESLLNKNKEKISDIQNLNKQNDRLSNEVKKLKEEKALFDSKIVSLENSNEHLNKKIREYEVFTQDLENQLESALEENITLQTEFETFKQTAGEQLIRKDDEIRDIKNDLLNKDKFIQRLQTKANNTALLKNLQKNFNENVTQLKRRYTLFPGTKGEEDDLSKLQKDLNNENSNPFLDSNFERSRSHTISDKDVENSNKKDNKERNSVFTSGFGSLSKLKNKKEELSKSQNNSKNIKKNENKYSYKKKENKNQKKSLFSSKNNKNALSPQIDEISEASEKEERKESKEIKIKTSLEVIRENQFEYINISDKNNNKEVENNTVIIEDLQKMLDRIRKRKEKLVNTKKANKERMKKLKQN